MLSPIEGPVVVTRPFGVYDPAYHNYPGSKHPGVDIRATFRTPYYATIDGSVISFDRDKNLRTGRGKEVRIKQGNTEVRYCHLDEIVVKGGTIKAGTLIGYAGWTGYVLPANINGTHLHFEVLINGTYVDPMNYIGKGETMTTFNQLQQMSHAVLGRITPVTKEWYDSNPPEKFMTTDQVLDSWIPSQEAQNFRYKGWDYDRLVKEFEDYKKANPISDQTCTPDERAYLDALKKITQ